MDQAPVYEELKGTELEVLCDVKEQLTDPIDTRSLVEIVVTNENRQMSKVKF